MIHVAWDDNKHPIINCKFVEGWTFPDLIIALDEMYALMESVTTEAYVIFDMSEANSLPSVKLLNFKAATIKVHPRIKLFVDVTDSLLIVSMTNLFKRVYRDTVQIEIVKTLDDAYQLIERDMQNTIENS